MKQIPLALATATQLAEFAQAHLGLAADRRMGADRLRALMATAGYDKDHIEIEEAGPPPARPPVPQAKPAAAGKDDDPGETTYVTVIIATQDYRGGDQPVPVSVNGRAIWIPRATPARIKRKYYTALMNANKKVYDPDPVTATPMPPREVPTYPVTLVSEG